MKIWTNFIKIFWKSVRNKWVTFMKMKKYSYSFDKKEKEKKKKLPQGDWRVKSEVVSRDSFVRRLGRFENRMWLWEWLIQCVPMLSTNKVIKQSLNKWFILVKRDVVK